MKNNLQKSCFRFVPDFFIFSRNFFFPNIFFKKKIPKKSFSTKKSKIFQRQKNHQFRSFKLSKDWLK